MVGCTPINESNYTNGLDNLLSNLDFNYLNRTNYATEYYEYYLPSDMFEVDEQDSTSIIEFLDTKTVMNLNISAIVNGAFFKDKVLSDEGFFKDSVLVYENNGSFIKNDEQTVDYTLSLYKGTDTNLLHFATNDLNFYSTTSFENLTNLVRHLIIISKSVIVKNDKVLADYSKKDVIEAKKIEIDLFSKYNIPSEGYLSELLKVNNNDVVEETGENIEEAK